MATHAERASGPDVASDHPLRVLYCNLLGQSVMSREPYTGAPASPLLPPMEIPKPASLMPVYVSIGLGGLVIGGLIILGITIVRPAPADNSTLISTAFVGIGVLIAQVMNFIKSTQAVVVASQTVEQVGVLHKSVNSGFEEFARLIRAEARAAGKKEAEEKQFDINAVEARIAAAVESAVARTLLATAPPAVPVAPSPSVDVATIQEPAVQGIAQAVTDALPPKDAP